jgi:hypothetical protein
MLQRRIELLCALPMDKLDRLRLEKVVRDIGLDRNQARLLRTVEDQKENDRVKRASNEIEVQE